MADIYTHVTACHLLKCRREECSELAELLKIDDLVDEVHGLEVKWRDADPVDFGAFIYAEGLFNEDGIPEAFLHKVGELLKKQGLPFLEFSFADTSDRMNPGTHSGGKFRIYFNGKFTRGELYWPGAV